MQFTSQDLLAQDTRELTIYRLKPGLANRHAQAIEENRQS